MHLSNLQKRLLRVVLRGSVHKSFGKVLLSPIKQINKIPRGLAFEYKIPPSLCRVQKSHPVISNAAVMAIFDELSSDAMMMVDKGHRGGVSVHLTTELIQPAPMNEEVVVITQADKIGKTLGFISMEMRNVKGDLLARGKHIKFMSMGWLNDLLVHPRILPVSMFVHENTIGKLFKTPLDGLFSGPREVADSSEGIGSVFRSLSLEKADVLPGEQAPQEIYRIHVKPHMMNQLGMFHGGCAAIAIEEACESYLAHFRAKQQHSEASKLYVEKMEVRYLASMKGELEIQLSLAQAPYHSNEVLLKGAIVSAKDRQIAIEFMCSCTTA